MAYSQIPKITCDCPGCDKVKSKENGWFLLFEDFEENNLTIVPFDESRARTASHHSCGITHTLQLTATAMGGWKSGSSVHEGHSSGSLVPEPRVSEYPETREEDQPE